MTRLRPVLIWLRTIALRTVACAFFIAPAIAVATLVHISLPLWMGWMLAALVTALLLDFFPVQLP
jgi:hypothetical protein